MKKTLCIFILLLIVIGITGCGNSDSDSIEGKYCFDTSICENDDKCIEYNQDRKIVLYDDGTCIFDSFNTKECSYHKLGNEVNILLDFSSELDKDNKTYDSEYNFILEKGSLILDNTDATDYHNQAYKKCR